MIDQVMELISKGRAYDDIVARLVAAEEERDRLKIDNIRLGRENRHLRRKLRDADMRLLRLAHADAFLLAALHFAGLPTSRRQVADVMPDRRWTRARGLLKLACLVDDKGIKPDLSVAQFEDQVAGAVEMVKAKGIMALRWRVSKHGQRSPRSKIIREVGH